jgi:hypothetical protein
MFPNEYETRKYVPGSESDGMNDEYETLQMEPQAR